MKNLKRISIFAASAVIVFALGSFLLQFSGNSQAQTKKTEVAWRHSEVPMKTINSEFKISLPSFSRESDWLVAVKPIKDGEKEKTYVGVFTWEDDKNGSARKMGYKQLSKMEDYPREQINSVDGEATLTTSVRSNQTLVIYMEIAPSTKAVFNEGGKEISLNAADGSSIIFDGKIEKAQIEHTGSLIATANVKKLQKEISKSGFVIKNNQNQK